MFQSGCCPHVHTVKHWGWVGNKLKHHFWNWSLLLPFCAFYNVPSMDKTPDWE